MKAHTGMKTTMPDPDDVPTTEQVKALVVPIMEAAWVEHGYTAPNTEVYPWLWLWDSCFHVLIWQALDRHDRAATELRCVLETQDGAGFVPHMGYQVDPGAAKGFWGRAGASSITQPPMYGHAIAQLLRAGVDVDDDAIGRAERGLRFLVERRRRDSSGLIEVVHPWETGCDDSPRWDHYCPGAGFDLERWRQHKRELLETIERGAAGEPLANPAFGAAPVSFSALTAWNIREFASASGRHDLLPFASELADAVAARWSTERSTWVDAGPGASTSGSLQTADAFTALLVVDDPQQREAAIAALADVDAYAGRFGPRGVHPDEPMYDPASYWRGPVWPQIAYLLWLGVLGDPAARHVADRLRDRTIVGAVLSGFAEYWDGDTAIGRGAVPQSWTALALVLANTRTISPSSSG